MTYRTTMAPSQSYEATTELKDNHHTPLVQSQHDCERDSQGHREAFPIRAIYLASLEYFSLILPQILINSQWEQSERESLR